MSIGHARYRRLRRSQGEAATRTAAYIDRSRVRDERTGQVHDYSGAADLAWRAVLLPDGAPRHLADAADAAEAAERRCDAQVASELVLALLWNAAEAAERRCDAQVASELVLALPAEAEVTDADRIALTRTFAQAHFVRHGLAVQIAIHAPEDKDRDDANWHAHLLVTTRRLGTQALRPGAGGFDRLKARDLDPVMRRIGGRAQVVEANPWGELWRAHQDRYFEARGYRTRVDPKGLVPEVHVGPRRTWHKKPEQVALLRACQAANRAATYDTARVLDALTRHNATFTGRDLDRLLARQLGQAAAAGEIEAVRAVVMASPDLRVLDDPDAASGRYSTRQVQKEEQAVLAAAAALAGRPMGEVARDAAAGRGLRPDQQAAFDHATAAGHLKLIAGRAGTGKSYTLAAIRAAHAAAGRRVIGLAPTHTVVRDMQGDGFGAAATVHSALFRLKNGKMRWGPETVVIVDEAAMLGTAILKELLVAADQAGAKLVLAGDDRQLASIERGGMFAELFKRHAHAEITEVVRQKGWQRRAAQDLAVYRFDKAVDAFEAAGAILWRDTPAAALDALVVAWGQDRADWRRDHPGQPDERRFVFAYTNKEVDALNARLRALCRAQGELRGPDVVFDVCHRAPDPGAAEVLHRTAFAVGDRVQFTRTDKAAGLVNGEVATITHLDAGTGAIRARLDTAAGPGREVAWNAHAFNGFRHGYAGTIHKGQGKTLDRTYLLHSRHWTAAPAYVALTRQRKAAAIFVSRATAADARQLARQMARTDERSAAITWAARRAGVAAPTPGHAPSPEGAEAHRDKKRRSVERIQARALIRDWSQRLAAYHAALAASPGDPAYVAARDRLLAFARTLREQPDQAARLHTAALDDQPLLRQMRDSTNPEQTIAQHIATAERTIERGQTEPNTRGSPRRQQQRSRTRAR